MAMQPGQFAAPGGRQGGPMATNSFFNGPGGNGGGYMGRQRQPMMYELPPLQFYDKSIVMHDVREDLKIGVMCRLLNVITQIIQFFLSILTGEVESPKPSSIAYGAMVVNTPASDFASVDPVKALAGNPGAPVPPWGHQMHIS